MKKGNRTPENKIIHSYVYFQKTWNSHAKPSYLTQACSNFFEKVVDIFVILCYNVFEVKGKIIRTLTKNEKK